MIVGIILFVIAAICVSIFWSALRAGDDNYGCDTTDFDDNGDEVMR